MDTIVIEGLVIECVIGCLAWERDIKQKVSLDLVLNTDIKQAALTDDVAHCLNYDELCKDLTAYIAASDFKLIETLAERVAERVLEHYPCTGLSVTVNKPGAIANAAQVGVTISRSR